MSDSDDDITHVFDQTNGVLDGFEGESDGAATSAAEGSGGAAGDHAPAQHYPAGAVDDGAAVPERGGEDADRGEEHTYAVDSRGTATDADATRTASSSGGAHVATAADAEPADDASDPGGAPAVAAAGGSAGGPDQDTEPTTVQHSEVADPPVDHDHDHEHHDHADHDHHDHADHDHAAPSTPAAATGLGALAGDDSVAHVFDQTNGVVDGAQGESDGLAEGDEASAADRRGLNEPNPVGQQDAWRDDHYGADDGRDPNP